jgi:hypothetical protein
MKHPVAAFYTTAQADGAWPNGATVSKVNSEPGDGTPDGTCGTIIGSVDARPAGATATYAYFVMWENRPGTPVFIADTTNDGRPRLKLELDA